MAKKSARGHRVRGSQTITTGRKSSSRSRSRSRAYKRRLSLNADAMDIPINEFTVTKYDSNASFKSNNNVSVCFDSEIIKGFNCKFSSISTTQDHAQQRKGIVLRSET